MRRKPRKVLVIDNDPERLASLRGTLAAPAFDVTVVGSGRRALAALTTATFDILIADVCTPQTDGLSVIKRARNEHPRLRMFAMVGDGRSLTMETASTLAEVWGAMRVFTKPFDAARLLAAIGSHSAGSAKAETQPRIKVA